MKLYIRKITISKNGKVIVTFQHPDGLNYPSMRFADVHFNDLRKQMDKDQDELILEEERWKHKAC